MLPNVWMPDGEDNDLVIFNIEERPIFSDAEAPLAEARIAQFLGEAGLGKNQHLLHHFRRMQRLPPRCMQNLLAAGDAGGDDERIGRRRGRP